MADQPSKPGKTSGDFGVPENDLRAREYASRNTRASDPGASHPRAGTRSRTAGVGGKDVGEGSNSGGDIDTDIIGVGEEPIPQPKGEVGGDKRVNGSTVTPSDDLTSGGGGGMGPDDATNPARGDDSFAGEVSSDEASGNNDQP